VPGVPGANDNGSGIATLLAIAEEIADKPYPFTIRFIAFGSEELGLEGSRYYVDNLTQDELDQILAMLNFHALGTSSASAILATDELADMALQIAGAGGIELVRQLELDAGTSDYAPFFDEGIPFVFFLGNDFSRIHAPEDTLEFVRPELMGNAAALAIGLLDELATQ
jgi:aminopeptidase YwaD